MSRVFSSKKSSVVTQRQFHDFSYKQGCMVATRVAGILAADFEDGDSIDGIQLATGNRILIKDQTDPKENGIYTVNSSGTPTRAADFNDNAEVDNGAFIFVSGGTHNVDKSFVLSHSGPVNLGATELNFHEIRSIPENKSVTTKKIRDLAVTAVKIDTDAVITDKIADNAVTAAKINTDAVITDKILNANVTTPKIANDAVTTAKILDDNVTNAKLANMTRGKIKVGGTGDAPTDLDAKTSGQILVGNGTDLLSVSVSGDATLAAGGALTIANDAVTTAKILDDNVTNAKLANMTRGKIKVGGTGDAPTDLDAKTSGQILVGNGTDLLSVSVSGDATLAAGGALTIANDAVTTAKILDDNVTNAKLANMTRGKIKVGGTGDAPTDLDAKTSGQILVGNGTDLLSVSVSGDATLAAGGALTIANDAVTTLKIADDSVTNAKLANMTRGKIKVGGVGDAPTDLDAKTSGKILVGNGTDLLSVSVSGDATLAAGGALTIATDVVTTAKILDDNVTNAKLANMTRGKIKVGGVGDAPTDLDAKTSGKILVGNGTDLLSVSVSGDATLAAGGALTIATDAVTTLKIADDSVTNAKLANMTRGKIKVGGTGDAPTDLDAKTSGQILVGNGTDLLSVSVSGDATLAAGGALTIATDAVTTAKILDDNVTTAKIADNAVTTLKIATDAVTTAKILDDNVTNAKLANMTRGKIKVGGVGDAPTDLDAKTSGKILVGNGTDLLSVSVSGDATLASGGALTIATDAVTTAKIADNAVTTAKIADNAVTTLKIANDAVKTAKILDGNVTTLKIAKDAVTTLKIADGNVTTLKIADANVTTAKILNGNVTTAKILDANVTTDKIADDAVTLAKIANYGGFGEETSDATQVLAYNASAEVGWFNVANVCFLEGTKITLPNHKIKNIEDLTLEDEILTYNIEGLSEIRNKNIISQWSTDNMKGEFSNSGIRNIWINPTDSYLEINGKLNVTKHHLIHFRRGNHGGNDCDKDFRYYFNFAENLMLDDELLTDKGFYEKIETIKEFKENINVYNIELDKDQTYFAENYLVHHYCKLCSGYANII